MTDDALPNEHVDEVMVDLTERWLSGISLRDASAARLRVLLERAAGRLRDEDPAFADELSRRAEGWTAAEPRLQPSPEMMDKLRQLGSRLRSIITVETWSPQILVRSAGSTISLEAADATACGFLPSIGWGIEGTTLKIVATRDLDVDRAVATLLCAVEFSDLTVAVEALPDRGASVLEIEIPADIELRSIVLAVVERNE